MYIFVHRQVVLMKCINGRGMNHATKSSFYTMVLHMPMDSLMLDMSSIRYHLLFIHFILLSGQFDLMTSFGISSSPQVLKDITVKYKILTGHRVHYVPGWDCHGVPIEQKALADLRTDSQKLSPLEIRSKGLHAFRKLQSSFF